MTILSKQRGDSAVVLLAILAIVVLAGLAWGIPRYNVYRRTLSGQAQLSEAEWNRQIKTLEAKAALESAKHFAAAEVERARGVAEANRIIGESLRGNEAYLRYLWIANLEQAEKNGAQVIYVPTEANLPIMEAGRTLRETGGNK